MVPRPSVCALGQPAPRPRPWAPHALPLLTSHQLLHSQAGRSNRAKLWPFLFFTVWKLLRTFPIVILEKENLSGTILLYTPIALFWGEGLSYSTQDLQLWPAVSGAGTGSAVAVYRLSCPSSTQDLTSPTRDRTCIHCVGRRILNHWTTRTVLRQNLKNYQEYQKWPQGENVCGAPV